MAGILCERLFAKNWMAVVQFVFISTDVTGMIAEYVIGLWNLK